MLSEWQGVSMALKSWLASLKSDVTAVTAVQAPIHAGLPCNGIEAAGVTGVTDISGMAAGATSVTVAQNQTLQPEPAWALGCTLVTSVTAEKINADVQTTATPTHSEPKRIFRQRGPWLTGREPMDAKAYHAHHFNCPQCIAAGRGAAYGQRCIAGAGLWSAYQTNTGIL